MNNPALHRITALTSLNTEVSSVLNFENMKKAFFMLRSVSHPLRKKILHLLEKSGPLSVSEIYMKLRVEQSVASQHLSVLRTAGVVKTVRIGKFVHYSLNEDRILEISQHIKGLNRV